MPVSWLAAPYVGAAGGGAFVRSNGKPGRNRTFPWILRRRHPQPFSTTCGAALRSRSTRSLPSRITSCARSRIVGSSRAGRVERCRRRRSSTRRTSSSWTSRAPDGATARISSRWRRWRCGTCWSIARGSARAQARRRARRITLDEARSGVDDQPEALLQLNEALDRLAAFEPRLARVVECRFFGGLTEEEIGRSARHHGAHGAARLGEGAHAAAARARVVNRRGKSAMARYPSSPTTGRSWRRWSTRCSTRRRSADAALIAELSAGDPERRSELERLVAECERERRCSTGRPRSASPRCSTTTWRASPKRWPSAIA